MVGSHLCMHLSPLQQPHFVLKPLLYAPGRGGPMIHEVQQDPQPGLDPLPSDSSHQHQGSGADPCQSPSHTLDTEQALGSPRDQQGGRGSIRDPQSQGSVWWSHKNTELLPQGGCDNLVPR